MTSELPHTDWRKPEHQATCLAGIEEGLAFVRNLQPEKSGLEDTCIVSLVGLLQTAQHSCIHLQFGWRSCDLPLLAWASRNSLEVMIWMKFVTASKANAQRFYLDWLNDAEDALRKSVELDRLTGADRKTNGVYRDLFDYDPSTGTRARARLDRLRQKHTSAPQKRLDIAKVAKQVGEGERFKNLNPIMSKFLHATAYSVLSFPTDSARMRTAAFMLDAGFWSLMIMIGTLDSFFGRATTRVILE